MTGALTERITTRIQQTQQAIDTEIRRTRSEAHAFKDFAVEVRKLDSSASSTGTAGTITRSVAVNTPNSRQKLKSAYKNTVMEVPHYKEEYGDSFQESFIAEFGAALGEAVLQGPSFDPRQRRLLLAKTQQARQDRSKLIDTLDEEQESVRTLSSQIREVSEEIGKLEEKAAAAGRFDSFVDIRSRLLTIESTSESLIATRQETLTEQRKTLSLPIDAPDVPTYLYKEMDVTYPLLASIADILSKRNSLQARVERGMVYAR